jgi:hypothetical protein
MKPDLPVTRNAFFAAAELADLARVEGVSPQRLSVVALCEDGPVLRFFAPVLRPLPEGTEINGSIGVALKSADGEDYRDALFLNILNLPQMLAADRLIRTDEDWTSFFASLSKELVSLPSTPQALSAALRNSATWMGRQLAWGDPPAISFNQKACELGS